MLGKIASWALIQVSFLKCCLTLVYKKGNYKAYNIFVPTLACRVLVGLSRARFASLETVSSVAFFINAYCSRSIRVYILWLQQVVS